MAAKKKQRRKKKARPATKRAGRTPARRKVARRKAPAGRPTARPARPAPPPPAWAWHELMSADPARVAPFYERLMGWSARAGSVTDQPYTVFHDATGEVAGLMGIPQVEGRPVCGARWLAYLRVPEVDETVARAIALGGQVEAPPMDIPGIGRFAVLQDPGGATFAVYAPRS